MNIVFVYEIDLSEILLVYGFFLKLPIYSEIFEVAYALAN